MEEVPSGGSDDDIVMYDSDQESTTSTIKTDHDSDEEWNVSAVLAAWKVEGSLRYLIEWEGYGLSEATWEPRGHLNEELIQEWEETKSRPDFDLYQKIRDWKKAWKATYAQKLARHNRRNELRVRRGEKPHSFEYMEGLLEWVNGFPDGEDTVSSAVSSPSVADGDSDVGVGQPLRPLPEKRKTSGTKSSENRSPNVSRRNSASSAPKVSLSRIDSASSATSHTQALRGHPSNGPGMNKTPNQKPAPTNSILSKFGRTGPAKRTEARAGKVQRTARKTQTAQAFTGNVFAGGKERKRRATLAEAAKDSTRTPKLFTYRHARIVEKAGRDRDGAAPTKMPSNLISLNPAERNGEPLSIPEIEAGRNESLVNTGVKRARHHDDLSETSQKPQKSKPKKSISWGTVEMTTFQEPTEFDKEHSLFLREETAPPEASWIVKEEWSLDSLPSKDHSQNPTIEPKIFSNQKDTPSNQFRGNAYVSTDKREANPSNKTITTDVQFGPGTRGIISVNFLRHEPQNELPWPAIFENMPTLIFTHTCMAQDFLSQENRLAADKLGKGLVVSNDDTIGLDAVTNWLYARSQGALLYRHDLCILVHTQSQAQAQTATAAEPPSLQYYLFRPAPHFTTRSLAPIALPGGQEIGKLLPQMASAVFDRTLGFQYEQLLTEEASAKNPSKHTFFLAFPKDTAQEAQFLCLWLRNCNSKCRILSSFFPGHWQTFLRLEQGVVIIHEEAIWSLRLFPDVRKLLYASNKFNFMLFSKSLHVSPLYPSLGQLWRVGDVSLRPLCSQKASALLVTPSFVVSQPQQVWNFFKWFWKAWSDARSHFTLVVCAGFDSWLLEVAASKENAWSRLPAHRAGADEKATITKELQALYKTRECVRKLQDLSPEEQSGLTTGPELIDSNDEQSLVNWFGWWSIMNLDRYRKFTVVGSASTDLGRLLHHTTRPDFTKSSTSDVAHIEEAERADTFQALQQEKWPSGPRSQSRLEAALGNTSALFEGFLDKLHRKLSRLSFTPLKLFPFPVAYWNEVMASESNDYHGAFRTYRDCLHEFDFMTNHGRGYKGQTINTGLALCYTIDGACTRPGGEEDVGKRRPWIVAWRPTHAHARPWRTSELIIWDPFVNKPNRDCEEFHEGDLAEAQQMMIQAVREGFDIELPLQHVWIADCGNDNSFSDDPAGRTLQQLEKLVNEWKLNMPIPVKAMKNKGWRQVRRNHGPTTSRHPSPERMDLDDSMDASDAGDQAPKIIFHPPRGKQLNGQTKCRNRFFQHCAKEKERGASKSALKYKFQPTMEWYKHQVEEGRGFEHISFMTWEEVFAKYKIEDPKKV
ncbi:hypothetical protein ACLX1H_001559 [Fusarium chlamydosporum]